ncbi:hypothetical protein [Paenibacillus sp.]|uniref:hypothetical protein n=1 Tax=Paenibacillus sp. TaxID=58172 RepID=UPI002D2DE44B|nr:hypothetical protein [Paenibacillus sp.]HZG83491.1 hypothetical protein [Paenibacillus sp.]
MHKEYKKYAKQLGLGESADITAVRNAVVSRVFQESIGKRVILLQESFPFLFVGEIFAVEADFMLLKTEFTNIAEFDGELFRIHLDTVHVFFIEDGKHCIPDIRT